MTPSRLRTLCEVEWPSMGVGWPPEGTMDLNLIKAVYAIVTGKPRHPDQFPYIDSWLGIAQDPPKWARFYAHGGEGKILMAQKITKDEKEILQDPEGDELPPPPYWMMVPPASNTVATGGNSQRPHLHHNPSLPLNGRTPSEAISSSSPGLASRKDSKTRQPSLEKPWPRTWNLSSLKGMDVGSCNMWTTCCWPLRPGKNAGKGPSAPPIAGRSGIPSVQEKGTNLQGGVKVAGIAPWIHHTRAKKAYNTDPEDAEWTTQKDPTDPRGTKIILKRKKRTRSRTSPLQDGAG
ncbi:uncharacterized protein LOC122679376 [Cervus elaphus]|uniref:uncharacterized protein LOC122679376 n=1 Tax=Cervus elaphus TaxID=9860 RepID=UPI001CC2B52F|nr:uncharacterized protein LOC122679376 [Cervus elaphus]